MPLGDGSKNVAAAGTAEQLSTVSTAIRWLAITARPGNTGKIAVGASTVRATAGSERGVLLAAGETVRLEPDHGVDDLAQVWVDATVSGNGVTFAYGTVR